MQTKHRPPATQRPPTHYPERRMKEFDSGKRGPETGMMRESRRPGEGRGRRCAPRSLVSGAQPPGFLAACFARQLSGLPVRAVRGRMGDRVFKTYGEKIVVTRVPCFDGYVPTAAQRQRREKMRAATAYAQAVYADPAAKAVYVAAAQALGRQPFRLAVSDFLVGRLRVNLCPASSTCPAPNSEESSKPHSQTPRPDTFAPPFRRLAPWRGQSGMPNNLFLAFRAVGWIRGTEQPPRLFRPVHPVARGHERRRGGSRAPAGATSWLDRRRIRSFSRGAAKARRKSFRQSHPRKLVSHEC